MKINNISSVFQHTENPTTSCRTAVHSLGHAHFTVLLWQLSGWQSVTSSPAESGLMVRGSHQKKPLLISTQLWEAKSWVHGENRRWGIMLWTVHITWVVTTVKSKQMIQRCLLTALIKLNTSQGSNQPSRDTQESVTSIEVPVPHLQCKHKFTQASTESLEIKRENSS